MKISDHFYGTGESFLYTFYPDFKVISNQVMAKAHIAFGKVS
jgi:hypothetical protein